MKEVDSYKKLFSCKALMWIASVLSSVCFLRTKTLSLSHEHYTGPERMTKGMCDINLGRKTLGGDSPTAVFCEIVLRFS